MAEMGLDFFRIDIRNETLRFPAEVQKLDNLVAYGAPRSKIVFRHFWYGNLASILVNMFIFYPDGGGGNASWMNSNRCIVEKPHIL